MGSRSTATSFINPRCTSRWSWPRQGSPAGSSDTPVSTRRIYHTVLSWAGLGVGNGLLDAGPAAARDGGPEAVLGESMKPFLEYGWQPQVMSIVPPFKSILAGKVETYDISADPREERNLGGGANVPKALVAALDDYPVPSPEGAGRRRTWMTRPAGDWRAWDM